MFLNKTIDDHDVPIHHNGIDSEHKDFQCKAGLINTSREMYSIVEVRGMAVGPLYSAYFLPFVVPLF